MSVARDLDGSSLHPLLPTHAQFNLDSPRSVRRSQIGHMASPLRVLFLTLEFSSATFSGNGVYAQSQVRALSRHHPVFVISAKPRDLEQAEQKKQGAEQLIEVGF
jgi:hypothetical protein